MDAETVVGRVHHVEQPDDLLRLVDAMVDGIGLVFKAGHHHCDESDKDDKAGLRADSGQDRKDVHEFF